MSIEEINDFYEKSTGRSATQGPRRVEKIQAYLEEKGLRLEQVKLENHKDPDWNTRRNRTALERQAECIGYTNHQYHGWLVEMWWVIPK